MRKMREVLLSASGLALAGIMLSATPTLAQSETDSSLSSAQAAQNADEQQSNSGAGLEQQNCSAQSGGDQAQALGDSAQQGCASSQIPMDRQALNQEQESQSQSQSPSASSLPESSRQPRLGSENADGQQALDSENQSNLNQDRDLDEQQQASSEEDRSSSENGRDADVQGSARDYDADRDQQQAANESEIQGQVGISGGQYAANPNATGRVDTGEGAVTGATRTDQDRDADAHGEALQNHEANETHEGAAASGGTLLLFGQITDPDRVLMNAEVEDNSGMVIGHLSRIEHEGGQDRAMIMLHDRKMVGLPTEHFRFDPARNLLIADLSEDQIEESAG